MVTYTCEQCGKVFERKRKGSQVARFCDKECYWASLRNIPTHNRKGIHKEYGLMWIPTKRRGDHYDYQAIVKCSHCPKWFLLYKHHFASHKATYRKRGFLCRSCAAKGKLAQGSLAGNNNPAWRGIHKEYGVTWIPVPLMERWNIQHEGRGRYRYDGVFQCEDCKVYFIYEKHKYKARKYKNKCGKCAQRATGRKVGQMTHMKYKKMREDNPGWKGGHTTKGGYMCVRIYPGHPYYSMVSVGGYVKEHRLVMAEHLGRPLSSGEHVHHLNGDKGDNRIENLSLEGGKQHMIITTLTTENKYLKEKIKQLETQLEVA